MKIVTDQIPLAELAQMARQRFGNFVKAVVDIRQGIMVVDADLHADQEALLLEKGAKQENLWGINLYPEIKSEDWIEFDSMINLRPVQNNSSRGVESAKIREQIIKIVKKLVKQ